MGDLKDSWKNTGKGLGSAFKNLGLSLLKTGENVVNKVDSAIEGNGKKKDKKEKKLKDENLACNRAQAENE
jgi:hypothetical protein